LLLLYVDDSLTDITPFGSVRRQAFCIMPEDTLRSHPELHPGNMMAAIGVVFVGHALDWPS
jgi:hypothetical protein